jgi:hypothetical protein
VWHPSSIDEVGRGAMISIKYRLGLFYRKNSGWDAAGSRRALRVSVGGGESPLGVLGVLRDVRVASAAGVLRCEKGCELVR